LYIQQAPVNGERWRRGNASSAGGPPAVTGCKPVPAPPIGVGRDAELQSWSSHYLRACIVRPRRHHRAYASALCQETARGIARRNGWREPGCAGFLGPVSLLVLGRVHHRNRHFRHYRRRGPQHDRTGDDCCRLSSPDWPASSRRSATPSWPPWSRWRARRTPMRTRRSASCWPGSSAGPGPRVRDRLGFRSQTGWSGYFRDLVSSAGYEIPKAVTAAPFDFDATTGQLVRTGTLFEPARHRDHRGDHPHPGERYPRERELQRRHW